MRCKNIVLFKLKVHAFYHYFLIKTVEITAYIRTVDAREDTAAFRFG